MEGHPNCRMLGYDKSKEYHLSRSRPSASVRPDSEPTKLSETTSKDMANQRGFPRCFLPPDQHIPGDGVRGLPITVVFGLTKLQQNNSIFRDVPRNFFNRSSSVRRVRSGRLGYELRFGTKSENDVW
ncbi:uncharacterized protein LOC134215169 [Armigeres subalbatus]|uniref:uncharacterized protein LOC134215169 n=1 Tax=Armigeres subalbatus TaxID=124917 RepID=UPI002ED66D2C